MWMTAPAVDNSHHVTGCAKADPAGVGTCGQAPSTGVRTLTGTLIPPGTLPEEVGRCRYPGGSMGLTRQPRRGAMMAQGGGFGRVLLWVVLGIVGLIVVGKVLGWLVGVLWNILVATLLIGAIVGVGALVFAAVRRSISGGNRPRLPR